MHKIIVVSAINIYEGGPLSILTDCLEYLSKNLSGQYRIIALVNNKKLVNIDKIELVEYPYSRKSWLCRLYYEYIHFLFISRRIKPHLWLSLHDITPNVTANIRAVYCHNASPFYKFSLKCLFYSYKVALFSLLYKYLYRINISKNRFVIVQQNWMRNKFNEMFDITDIVVSYPNFPVIASPCQPQLKSDIIKTFIYPAFPRVFKNYEVVAEAAKYLHDQGRNDFNIIFTISGNENKFAHHIVSKYINIPVISFVGLRSRDEIFSMYQQVDALLFPSKLETWGLPITEAKHFNLPIFLADLPYARETVGNYDNVMFFSPDDHIQLSEQIKSFIDGDLVFDGNVAECIKEPFAQNWHELFNIILAPRETNNA